VTAVIAGYVSVNFMTFEKQSNAPRTTVESKSNRKCNHSASGGSVSLPAWLHDYFVD